MEGGSEPLILEAPVAPDPGTVHIKSVETIGGSGCPQGTATARVSPDGLSMITEFFSFLAARGPNIPLSRSRLQCTLILRISVPQGYTFTLTQIDNRGFVNIPSGVTARQQSSYRMQGNSDTAEPNRTEFKGPATRSYLVANKYDREDLVWSDCGLETNLIVDTSLLLTGSQTSMSLISLDALNQSFTQRYRMRWKTCRN